jgi:hypothetical protein
MDLCKSVLDVIALFLSLLSAGREWVLLSRRKTPPAEAGPAPGGSSWRVQCPHCRTPLRLARRAPAPKVAPRTSAAYRPA